MGPKTKFIVFCSTVHKDASWKFMIKYFKAKGRDVEVHTALKENGVDLLEQQIKILENEPDPEDIEMEDIKPEQKIKMIGNGAMNAILAHNLPPEVTGMGKKEKKSKYNERKYIWVLDDLSTELRSKSLPGFLKKSRHFGCCLISSQYYLDLDPQSRAQLDYMLVYKGAREDKLEAMWKDADLTVDYPEYKKLYEDATEEPYNFLYVDIRKSELRKNFNTAYDV